MALITIKVADLHNVNETKGFFINKQIEGGAFIYKRTRVLSVSDFCIVGRQRMLKAFLRQVVSQTSSFSPMCIFIHYIQVSPQYA